MRLLLPLVCGVVGSLSLSSVSPADDVSFVIKSITVEARADAASVAPARASASMTGEKTAMVMNAAAPKTTAELEPDADARKAGILRGSVLMLLLPNLRHY